MTLPKLFRTAALDPLGTFSRDFLWAHQRHMQLEGPAVGSGVLQWKHPCSGLGGPCSDLRALDALVLRFRAPSWRDFLKKWGSSWWRPSPTARTGFSSPCRMNTQAYHLEHILCPLAWRKRPSVNCLGALIGARTEVALFGFLRTCWPLTCSCWATPMLAGSEEPFVGMPLYVS